jgi:hypothetical protein
MAVCGIAARCGLLVSSGTHEPPLPWPCALPPSSSWLARAGWSWKACVVASAVRPGGRLRIVSRTLYGHGGVTYLILGCSGALARFGYAQAPLERGTSYGPIARPSHRI